MARLERLMADEPNVEPGSFPNGVLVGHYSNYFQIGHNALEFLLDFGQLFDDGRVAQFHTRIIIGPSYAKELLQVLTQAIKAYDEAFGGIVPPSR
jgi:hypothetical protein